MSVESKSAADASIGELMSQLSAQTSRLVRDEMRLAQKELQESAKHAGIGAGLISVAGLLSVLGLATLIAAGVAALGHHTERERTAKKLSDFRNCRTFGAARDLANDLRPN